MFHHPRLMRSLALIALLAVVMFWSGDRAAAIQGRAGKVRFGPISVAKSEAVRLNIYAVGDAENTPADFVLRIFNTRGEVGGERRLSVAPGVTSSVEVNIGNPDLFPVDRLGRRTLRAEIVGFNPQPDPPGFTATLEIYNHRTGASNIVLSETFVGDVEHVPGGQLR
jgi:hypothetical protein